MGTVPPISLRSSAYEVATGESAAVRMGMWGWSGAKEEGGQYDCFSCGSGEGSNSGTLPWSWSIKGDDAFFPADESSSFNPADPTVPSDLKGYVHVPLTNANSKALLTLYTLQPLRHEKFYGVACRQFYYSCSIWRFVSFPLLIHPAVYPCLTDMIGMQK